MGSSDTKSDPIILEQNHETVSNKSEPVLELTSTSDSEDNGKKVASPSSSVSSTISIHLEDSDTKKDGKVNEGIDHTSETPPIQVVMERERPKTPKYRIPSSVFSRKQKSGSQDWSMASNESLFSIQMSFNYQNSFNWKSGDLDRYLQEVGPIPETDETGKTHGSETGKIQESSIPESESGKSFAFPVLTGDKEKGGRGSLEAISESEEPEKEKQKEDTPNPTWTNCFGCCTFCS